MIDLLSFTLAAADAQPPSSMPFFLQIGAMFVVIYFLFIRPQQKRQKEQAALIAAAKIGDKVIMRESGIHGIISNVKETTVVVKVADNVKIEFEKSSIGAVIKPATEA